MLTNELNLPQPFVEAATDRHRFTPNRYSVSDVLGGTCEAILKRRHHGEQDEDVADRVWAIFGTAVHKVLEQAKATETQMQEHWMSVPIKGTPYEMSGIFDLYDEATGTVTDWKTTSVWSVMLDDHERWRLQTLLYCWMLRQKGYEARRGEIVAILRDHSMRKARTERDYPPHPVMRMGWDFTAEDFDEAERLVSDWFLEAAAQEALPDAGLEPCSPEQRWHKPDKWAVMEKGKKKALRLLGSEREACEWAEARGIDLDGKSHRLEFREGEDTRCQSYCPVSSFCPHGKKILE